MALSRFESNNALLMVARALAVGDDAALIAADEALAVATRALIDLSDRLDAHRRVRRAYAPAQRQRVPILAEAVA